MSTLADHQLAIEMELEDLERLADRHELGEEFDSGPGLYIQGPICRTCGDPRWECTPIEDRTCRCAIAPDPLAPF